MIRNLVLKWKDRSVWNNSFLHSEDKNRGPTRDKLARGTCVRKTERTIEALCNWCPKTFPDKGINLFLVSLLAIFCQSMQDRINRSMICANCSSCHYDQRNWLGTLISILSCIYTRQGFHRNIYSSPYQQTALFYHVSEGFWHSNRSFYWSFLPLIKRLIMEFSNFLPHFSPCCGVQGRYLEWDQTDQLAFGLCSEVVGDEAIFLPRRTLIYKYRKQFSLNY